MPLISRGSLLLALSFALPAGAQTQQPVPPMTPLDPALSSVPTTFAAPETLRELPPAAAAKLLASTEGPAWRVFQVHAPSCEKKPSSKNRKAFRQIQQECKLARKFAKKYRAQIACSALYVQTRVWLTTVPEANKPSENPQPDGAQ